MEKVIKEFKIIETDDGFRIEIKGDKEVLRKMLKDFGPQSFFGSRFPFGRGFHFGCGPGFWDWFAGGWCGFWEEAEEEKKTRD